MKDKSVLITGASGLLGRALSKQFKENGWKVHEQALSRCQEGMVKLDLCDFSSVRAFINKEKPSLIVHSAAERRPDVVENDFSATLKLNVEASGNIADVAKGAGSCVLYISTDYAFDGKSPPYAETSPTHPINKYGESKVLGERAVMQVNQDNLVVRIPVLYGHVLHLKESAVSYMLEFLLGEKPSPMRLSHYEIRHPTSTNDVAYACERLAQLKLQDPDNIHGIYHCSAEEPLTKYDMLRAMADSLSLSCSHVFPDTSATPGAPRPYNSKLSTQRLKDLGINRYTPFKQGIKECLQEYVK